MPADDSADSPAPTGRGGGEEGEGRLEAPRLAQPDDHLAELAQAEYDRLPCEGPGVKHNGHHPALSLSLPDELFEAVTQRHQIVRGRQVNRARF